MTTPARIHNKVAAAARCAAQLRLMPVSRQCERCGAPNRTLVQIAGEWVCQDRVDCFQAWRQ